MQLHNVKKKVVILNYAHFYWIKKNRKDEEAAVIELNSHSITLVILRYSIILPPIKLKTIQINSLGFDKASQTLSLWTPRHILPKYHTLPKEVLDEISEVIQLKIGSRVTLELQGVIKNSGYDLNVKIVKFL